MRYAVLGGVVGAVAGVCVAVALASSSRAAATTTLGSYTITACSPGSSAGQWAAVNGATASLTTTNSCGGVAAVGPDDAAANAISTTGALFGEDQIGSTTSVPTGSEAGWVLSVPTGIKITAISYYSSYETDGGGWLAGLQIDGDPQATDCETNLNHTSPCAYYNNQTPQEETGLNATSLFFGVECLQVDGGADSCSPAPFGSNEVEAALYSAQVTLEDDGLPAVQDEGGPLWGSGVVSGTVPVTFDATDPAGVQSVQVLSGTGATVLDQQQSCSYTQVQACPELSPGVVEIDTTQLSDGSQHVQLVVTNAAGNTTVVQGPTVVVDNHGPPAPTQLSASAASPSSDVINLAWANPANPPQPVAAAYAELCQSACGDPIQISDSGAAQLTAPAAGNYTVHLWLTDIDGRGGESNAATTTVTVPASRTQTVTTTSTTTTTTTTTTTVPVPVKTTRAALCKTCPAKRTSGCAIRRCPTFKVVSARWSAGKLTVRLKSLPKNDRLKVTLYYRHAKSRSVTVSVKHDLVTIRTGRPTRTVLVAVRGSHRAGAAITVRGGA